MKTEYISVKEFAERAGISFQTVYQQMKKRLKQYVKVENGIKLINTDALSLYNNSNSIQKKSESTEKVEISKVELKIEPQALNVEQLILDKAVLKAEKDGLIRENELLKNENEMLKNQLAEKDIQLNMQMKLNENMQIIHLNAAKLLPKTIESTESYDKNDKNETVETVEKKRGWFGKKK